MRKSIIFIALLAVITCTGITSCSRKPLHESPRFVAVVDSICEKYSTDKGYDAAAVKDGMHDYVAYYSASENPIFKDTPFTVTGIIVSPTLDGTAKYAYIFMKYELEEQTKVGKQLYALHLSVENKYAANDSIDVIEGNTYLVSPENGMILYDGKLDLMGVSETKSGDINDTRSFGTLKLLNGAKFKPVNQQ